MRSLPWVLLIIACIPTYHYGTVLPATYELPDPRTIPAPLDSLWPAIVDVVNERQLGIKLVDKSSGLLQSERMWAGNIDAYWDCGQIHIVKIDNVTGDSTETVERVRPDNVMVTITLSGLPRGPSETTLRITANVSGGCVSKGIIERELLNGIERRWTELRRP